MKAETTARAKPVLTVVGMTSMAIVAGTCSRQQPLDSSSVSGIFFNLPFGVTGIRRGTESQTLAWCEAVTRLEPDPSPDRTSKLLGGSWVIIIYYIL